MSRFFSRKSQSLIEYSLILAIVGAALVGMQFYMKRGLQAAIKISADQLGSQQGAQVLINFRRQTNSISETRGARAGAVRTQVLTDGSQTRNTSTTSTSVGSSTSVSQQQQ